MKTEAYNMNNGVSAKTAIKLMLLNFTVSVAIFVILIVYF